jgi:hypothetical protein
MGSDEVVGSYADYERQHQRGSPTRPYWNVQECQYGIVAVAVA